MTPDHNEGLTGGKLPRIIAAPIRTLRSQKSPEEVEKDLRMFYEKEIEANRQKALPVDVSGYSKKAPMPVPGSGSKHSSGTGNWRTRDEWTYGVTIYLP